MRAAVLHGPRDVRVEEIPQPKLQLGDVLLRIRACGICGSDLHVYKHGILADLGAPVAGGRVLGHEFSGEIADTGGEVEGWSVGDRVIGIGFGANAEYFLVPGALVRTMRRLPPELPFEIAATTEPLATSYHAVNLSPPTEGQTVVVLGVGIIGLGVSQVLKALYSARVIAVDLSEHRLQVAASLGADVVINATDEVVSGVIRNLTGSTRISFVDQPAAGVDIVFDCAGVSREQEGASSLQQAIELVRENGTVVLVAASERPLSLDLNPIMRKGVRLLGSWAWSQREFTESLELIASGKIDRRPLISHEFPLERAPEAYEMQLRPSEAIKVLIKP